MAGYGNSTISRIYDEDNSYGEELVPAPPVGPGRVSVNDGVQGPSVPFELKPLKQAPAQTERAAEQTQKTPPRGRGSGLM